MEDQKVSFETAKLAKEKNFNIPVFYHYSENPINDLEILCEPDDPQLGNGWQLVNYNSRKWVYKKYSAPTQPLLQKWLREVHNIHVEPSIHNELHYFIMICIVENNEVVTVPFHIQSKTYEEALEVGLQEGLKQIK